MATVSLCMIVCNEEAKIRRCLKSVTPFVHEIIVVDTGSCDRTKEICLEFGANVFDFTWIDNFSTARNYSLSKASGDWILWLDADEELEVKDAAALEQCLQEDSVQLLSVPCIQFYGDKPVHEKKAYLHSTVRLFRKCLELQFVGAVYEHLDWSQHNINAISAHSFMRILHDGFINPVVKEKSERNIGILLGEKENMPYDPWILYYLGLENYRIGALQKAYSLINESIACFLQNDKFPPASLYKLKYDLLTTTSNFDAAYPSIDKAIALYPDYVDLHFYKGIILLAKKQYDKANKVFEKCLLLGEGNPRYLTLIGVGSFLALYYSSFCLIQKEEYKKAYEALQKALYFYPDFEPAIKKLEDIKKKL